MLLCLSFVECDHSAVFAVFIWPDHMDYEGFQQPVGCMAGCYYLVASLDVVTRRVSSACQEVYTTKR